MTRSLLLTFLPDHPAKMYPATEEIYLESLPIPHNKELYFYTETREKVYCDVETLDPLHKELSPITSMFICEDLIPTGIFDISYIDNLINNQMKTMKIVDLNILDTIREIALHNTSTILALYYIKERLIAHNVAYVEIKYV